MKTNKTEIVIVLDRSGSMATMKADMEGGFKTFLNEQKKLSGECYLTLFRFDSVYEAINIHNINEVIIEPRNSTALIDAIGNAVVETGQRFAKMDEQDRPQNVIFVTITDGEENASREYKLDQVKDMVKLQTDTYKWRFVFLGAGIDSIKVGAGFGFAAGTSMDYNKGGSTDMFRSLSAYTCSVVQDSNFSGCFTEEDRKKSLVK